MKDFYEATVRVRYAETDQMGFVYHSNFLVWFEVGRVEMLRELGVRYKEMEQQDDCHIVVVEARCQFKKPARYDEVLRIRTRLTESRTRTIRFAYEVLNPAGEVIATGETNHVICDSEGRPKTLPEKYRQIIPLSASAGAGKS